MKVLMVCVPVMGHVNPLVPVAEAFTEAGDDVFVATGPGVEHVVEAMGATYIEAGRRFGAWFERLGARGRTSPGDGLAPARIMPYFLPRVFGEVGIDEMIDGVLAAAAEVSPDLIVFETFALAAPLAAEVLGVPRVHIPITLPLGRQVLDLIDDAVTPMWRRLGYGDPGSAGLFRGLAADIWPSILGVEDEDDGVRLSLRPARAPQSGTARSDPPTVYVTLGTIYGSNHDTFVEVLGGLADLDARVVVTVGPNQDPARLRAVAPDALVERYIPHATVLPRCSAVIHHGGSGTMFDALAHGLPQVVLPQGADHYINARAVTDAGVGVSIEPDGVSSSAVRAAVRDVLTGPTFVQNAALGAAQIAEMPSAQEFVQAVRSSVGARVSV